MRKLSEALDHARLAILRNGVLVKTENHRNNLGVSPELALVMALIDNSNEEVHTLFVLNPERKDHDSRK